MSLDVKEFDRFADEYLATHAANLAVSGEGPEYFARYKIDELVRRYRRLRLAPPRRILDFGCGIGASIPHLRSAFPEAEIVGLDVSERSLAIAESRFPGMARLVAYDGADPGLPAASFDLVFSACVFHHIEAPEHEPIFARLRGLLAPDGVMVIFEHNPLNPVSRYIVATCPFDENAVLIEAGELARRQRRAGFSQVTVAYTGFFPRPLKALRALEPLLTPVPIGAQYYTLARP